MASATVLRLDGSPQTALGRARSWRPVSTTQWHVPELAEHLVESVTPWSAIVCRYHVISNSPPSTRSRLQFQGGRTITTGLAPASQRWFKAGPNSDSACRKSAAEIPLPEVFMVKLRYADHDLWIAGLESRQCTISTNGRFDSTANIARDAAAAYETGRWLP